MVNKYPYTNFNEYNLDWIIERVKTLTEDWLSTKEEWDDTKEEWETLYNYVHDYFDNLDVSQEVGQIINDYRLDGTLSTICQPIVDHWVETNVPNQINEWLDTNITQETGYVLDRSLTLSNAAAPADLVGDLKQDLTESALYLSDNSTLFESGNISVVDGTNFVDTASYRTKDYIDKSIIKVDFDASYQVRILVYNISTGAYIGVWKNGNITQTTVNIEGETSISDIQKLYNIRLCFYKGGSTVSSSDLEHIYLYNALRKKAPANYIDKESLSNTISNSLVQGLYEEPVISFGEDNRYINVNNGVISDAGALDVHVTDYIDCSNIRYIRYTGSSYYAFGCLAFYTNNKTFIRAYPNVSSNTDYWMEEIQVPANAKYVVFENNSAISGKLPVKIEFMETYSMLSCRSLLGKKWVCIGDSHTEINDRASMRYMDFVKIATGINTVNMGVSGTGYANRHAENLSFYDRVSSVPTDADVVTIYGSFNDVFSVNPLPLGDVTDSGTSTICGFINGTIDNLYDHFIRCNLGIVTPCPWENSNPANVNSDASKYVDAIIDICKMRGIPCLDLFHCSGLRPWESDFRTIYYSNDEGNGVHPNELGHELIAPRFKEFIESLVM